MTWRRQQQQQPQPLNAFPPVGTSLCPGPPSNARSEHARGVQVRGLSLGIPNALLARPGFLRCGPWEPPVGDVKPVW